MVLLPTSGTQRLLELHELAASQPLAAETLLAGGVGIANQTRAARNVTQEMLKVRILRTHSRLASRCLPLLLTPSPVRLARMEPPHRATSHPIAQAHVAPPPSRPLPLRPSPVELPPLRSDAVPNVGDGDEEVSSSVGIVHE